jgi:hypothetical protein
VKHNPAPRGPRFPVFGQPILWAVVSAIGLLAALLGDGVWDALSWIMLGAPVVVILRHAARPAAGSCSNGAPPRSSR